MAYAFDDASAEERHTTQYFEMFCNRGIYHEGWTAVTRHSTPWVVQAELPAFDDDVWELYDTNTDWTQARDLAADSRTSSPSCRSSSSQRHASTTFTRWTTGVWSASTPI